MKFKFLLIAILGILPGMLTTSCKQDPPPSPKPAWIAEEFARVLEERGYIKDANTITPEEVAELENIDVSGPVGETGPITSVAGIEYFIRLKWFNCSNNQISEIDLSNNTQLKWFACENNKLTQLDLSHNTLLSLLHCCLNNLTELDLSNNPLLFTLSCWGNQIAELDLSNNRSVRSITCCFNELSSLDLSNQIKVWELLCYDNPGKDGIFEVITRLDESAITDAFTTKPWLFDGKRVEIVYKKPSSE